MRFISVAIGDPPRDVRAFVGRYGWTAAVARDEEHRWVAAFGSPGCPRRSCSTQLDTDGEVIQTFAGPVTEERIDAALDPLVSSSDTLDSAG